MVTVKCPALLLPLLGSGLLAIVSNLAAMMIGHQVYALSLASDGHATKVRPFWQVLPDRMAF